jgi:PAS domain S-box-containing protein
MSLLTWVGLIAVVQTCRQNWSDFRSSVAEKLEREKVMRENLEAEATRHSEINEAQRRMIEAIPFPLVVTKKDGVLPIGQQAARLFKVGPSELPNHSIEDFFVNPQDQKDLFEQLATKGRYDEVELQMRDAEGKEFWVMSSARPLSYEGEDCFLNSVIPIEDRKHAEEALAQKEAQLRVALDNMPGGMSLYDADLNIVVANDKVHELFNFSPSLVEPGKSITAVFRYLAERGDYGPGDIDEHIARRIEAYKSRERRVSEARTPDGRIIDIRLSPATDGGTVAVFDDVTEDRIAEEELAIAKQRAEEANRAKSEFLAVISHEIRTPMNGVIGTIDLLNRSTLNADQKQMTGVITESTGSLLRLIDDILDFSKIEAGKTELESIPLSLTDLVEGVVESLAPAALAKELSFYVFIDPAIPEALLGDPVRLRQILFNLGGNAIKFTDTGHVIIRVDPIPSDARTKLRIQVIDTGIGIDDDVRDGLFQPFSQADGATTRQYGGTGLGLSISRRLARLMDGEIGVDSKLDGGSTFWVDVTLDAAAQAVKTADPDFDLSGLNVMVALPDEVTREFYLRYLRHAGAKASECVTRSEVMASARQAQEAGAPFDIVILADCEGEMAGSDLREDFPQSGVGPATQFVILYRRKEEGLQDRCWAEGFATHLTMPTRRGALLRAVAAAAGRASPEVETVETELDVAIALEAPTREEALAEGRLVLLAEDHPTNQQVLVRQLNALGYAADTADDGKAALEACERTRYALVLADRHMPRMDGFEFTHRIRADEKSSGKQRLPIIAVTASVLEGEAERCLANGMDDYLSKPVRIEALRRVLQHWLPGVEPAALPAQESTQPADPDLPLDLAVLKPLFAQEQETLFEFLGIFMKTAGKTREQLADALSSRAITGVAQAAHKLKGSAFTAGAEKLAQVATALEVASHDENWADIERLTPELDETLAALAAYIDTLAETLPETAAEAAEKSENN